MDGGDFVAQDSVFEQPGDTASATSIDGGGIWLEGNFRFDPDGTSEVLGALHIVHSVFRNLSARNGGAIFINGGVTNVLGSRICGTEALENGGAVILMSSTSPGSSMGTT